MSDYGHEQTDKELKRIEKLISKEYGQAAKELEEKMKKHLAKFEKKDVLMKKKLDAGQITEEEYKNWRIGQIAIGERWKEVRDSMTNTLVNTDKTAAAIIQGNSIKAYGDNMNYGTYEVEHGAKINTGFSLYDENTVKNLLKEDPKLIPMPKVDIPKDELWNRQKLTSAVTQGILQGESIPGIAKRLASVADMDKNAAIRNARTYTTAAENKGRVDSYERAKDLGIKVKKKWIATLDDRTRVEHRHLDNMVVDNDAEFETDGYKISYPGDPSADPEMIYNCRCTLVAEVEGVKYNDERNDSKLGDMTYEEWKHAKDKPTPEIKSESKTKNVENIRQEIFEKIKNNENLSELPNDLREQISESIGTNNEKLLNEINKALDKVQIHFDEEPGTSHHTYQTESIVLHETRYENSTRGDEDIIRTLWHEFGHFVDDPVSESDYGYNVPLSSGDYFIHGISMSVENEHKFADAVCKDVNAFLERYGLSDKFEMTRADEWSIQWLKYKKTGESYDITKASPEDAHSLFNALNDWMHEQSGYNIAKNYLIDNGYPKDVEYSDYMISYYTPKRHELKYKEKYKGAEEDFYKKSREVSEQQSKFREREDWDQLIKTQSDLYDKAREKESALGWVTDTFDGGSYGAFASAIIGGHTSDYYQMNHNGIRESVANVFMAETTQDKIVIDGMKDLCPNVYGLIKGELENVQ